MDGHLQHLPAHCHRAAMQGEIRHAEKQGSAHESASNTYANHSLTQHKTQPEKGKAIGLQH